MAEALEVPNMKKGDIRISVAIPTYSDLPPEAALSVTRACLVAQKRGYDIDSVGCTQRELLCHARNRIIEGFLSTSATHLFCLDADIVLPNYALTALVEADQDVVTGIYFQKEPPYRPVIMVKGGFSRRRKKERGLHSFIIEWPENTIFPIDAAGMGCCLIKREVFEKIKAPWFAWTEESGEDIGFFMRLRKENVPIFCHSGVICGHVKSKVVDLSDFKGSNLEVSKQIQVSSGIYAREVIKDGCNIRG